MENQLNWKQSINVLIQAAEIGKMKGAYSLSDAEIISQAVKFFTKDGSQESVSDQDQENNEGNKTTKLNKLT
jgi:hypothetical protein